MSTHYNTEQLKEVAGGDEEFMAVVAQAFLEEIPPDLEALEEAISNDNRELAYQFAHKMKPNIEMFGIAVLKDITTIEAWTKTSKNSAHISDELDNVVTTLKLVFEELKSDFNL
ncbi:Hpt domain-containing protein [Altibacter sp. HG106]|uniref:Hpt domain-containing protein n=1 Tax=Altibacter sp. HG106 TaxID=3023937 RepID=UPI00235079C9|nr:Hpt domain-containing protein [Altibacter sp. HG106]MDC7994010.1 Hpt domain-containing protein [Altibacter sp. HG106]